MTILINKSDIFNIYIYIYIYLYVEFFTHPTRVMIFFCLMSSVQKNKTDIFNILSIILYKYI